MSTNRSNNNGNERVTVNSNTSPWYMVAILAVLGMGAADAVAAPAISMSQGLQLIANNGDFDVGTIPVGGVVSVGFVIRNVGDQTLTISLPSLVDSVGEINGLGSTAQTSVQPNGFAPLGISFDVNSAGPFSATLQLTTNDPSANPFLFNIVGETAASSMLVSFETTVIEDGDTFDLGTANVGESVGEAFTIRNLGNAELEVEAFATLTVGLAANFQGADSDLNIAPNLFGVLPLGFTISQGGPVEFDVTLVTNDPDNPDFTFTLVAEGNEVAAPQLSMSDGLLLISSGDAIDLDPVEVGDTEGVALTLRNVGDGLLEFDDVKVSVDEETDGDPTDLEVNLAANDIAPGGFAIMTIGFTPSTAGEREFEVQINSNDPANPFILVVTAEGLEAEEEVLTPSMKVTIEDENMEDDDTFDLGEVLLGNTITELIEITNEGDAPLQVALTNLVGSQSYTVEFDDDDAIEPGETKTMIVTYTATAAEEQDLTITLATNDPEKATFSMTITALGVEDENEIDNAPRMEMSVNGQDLAPGVTLNLGTSTVGESRTIVLDIRNTGTADLLMSAVVAVEQLEGTNSMTASLTSDTLAPGETGNLVLSKTATTAGTDRFELTIESNDPNNGQFTFRVTDEVVANGNDDEIIDDCNQNGFDDLDDIDVGESIDCNQNDVPDECENDSDNDGTPDECDRCPGVDDDGDTDNDGVSDCEDNCPNTPNEKQADADFDGVGDECDDTRGFGPPGAFCGFGALGLTPLMMLGLCGMRRRQW